MLCLYCYTSPKPYTFAQQKVYHVIFFFAVKFGWYYKKHYFCIAFGEMHCTK